MTPLVYKFILNCKSVESTVFCLHFSLISSYKVLKQTLSIYHYHFFLFQQVYLFHELKYIKMANGQEQTQSKKMLSISILLKKITSLNHFILFEHLLHETNIKFLISCLCFSLTTRQPEYVS